MTSPEAKAKELFDKYDEMNFHDCADHEGSAKECAIICVSEIIDLLNGALIEWHVLNTEDEILDYWEAVKTEIIKL